MKEMISNLSKQHTPNAFLLYLHFIQVSNTASSSLPSLLSSFSSFSLPYQQIFSLVLPSLFTPSLLPSLLSFYHQQILLHSNDSLYLYLLVGITRLIQILTPLSIPPSYSSTISFFISSILSPFLLCIEPHLQAKTRSHRRTDTSITYDTLKQLSLSTTTIDSIPSEQTLTILTCGFSLLSYFHSVNNETAFNELLSICLEFCKGKYPIEYAISSYISLIPLLKGKYEVNDTVMKRLEVLLINQSNYSSRLIRYPECCALANLLLTSFYPHNETILNLLKKNEENNKWFLPIECTPEDLLQLQSYEKQYHWSFTEFHLYN